MYKFLLNDFEGPLDLLLHLVKTSKMDIYEIKLVDITNQYINYIENMMNLNLDVASEYLVMASELIEMKSRYLINKKDDTEEDIKDENEEELKRRLLEYKKYKESLDSFKELEEKRNNYYTKSPEKISDITDKKIENTTGISIFDLLDAFSKLLERQEFKKPLTTKITTKELSIKEKTIKIRNMLKTKKRVKFEELFELYTKEHVVVTFLSILQMAKNNEIHILQNKNFDEILIERTN